MLSVDLKELNKADIDVSRVKDKLIGINFVEGERYLNFDFSKDATENDLENIAKIFEELVREILEKGG